MYLVARQRAASAPPAGRLARIVAELHPLGRLKHIAGHVGTISGVDIGQGRVVQRSHARVGLVARVGQVKAAIRTRVVKAFVSLVAARMG